MLKILFKRRYRILKKNLIIGPENINMIINTRDILGEINDDNINLIQQYYKDDNEIRQNEINFSLLKNIENKNIDKIYLLNESIYNDDILKNKKIKQININKRLEYIDFFNFIKEKKGYFILSNCDIFFDESINKIKYGLLSKKKCIYCLTRYEYENEKKIKINKKYKHCSQDTWIIHSNYNVKNISEFKIKLGKPYCDNRLAYLLYQEDFLILNDMKKIKSYHYHNSNVRNYHQIKDKINGKILHINPTI